MIFRFKTGYQVPICTLTCHIPKILRSILSNKSHLWDRSKKQVRVFFDFVDISVLNSKSLYDKMESAVPISSLNFRFNLARSMIGKFWNRNRAVPTSRPSKRLLLIIYLNLPQLVPNVLSARLKRLKIENLSAVHHATYTSASRKREIDFTTNTSTSEHFWKLLILM